MAILASWLWFVLLLVHTCSAKHDVHGWHTSKKSKQINLYPPTKNGTSYTHHSVLIINIIGDSPEQLEGAISHALSYINLSALCTKSTTCRAFMPALHAFGLSSEQEKQVRQLRSAVNGSLHTYPPSLITRNIGSSSDALPEHVSEILFSLATVEQEFRTNTDNPPVALSLSFSSLSFPVFDNIINFQKIFQKVSRVSFHGKKVLLLEKNNHLTSPSDWHDLQVVVMTLASRHSQKWLAMVQKVFSHHANRSAFTLREPRAAIMESIHTVVNRHHVGFLDTADVCLLPGQEDEKVARTRRVYTHTLCPLSASARTASLPLLCSCPSPATAPAAQKEEGSSANPKPKPSKRSFTCPCSNIHPPRDWVPRLEPAPSLLNHRVGRKVSDFLKTLPECEHFGAARFRFTNQTDMPQEFCWDTG